jgi:hypothetical protein
MLARYVMADNRTLARYGLLEQQALEREAELLEIPSLSWLRSTSTPKDNNSPFDLFVAFETLTLSSPNDLPSHSDGHWHHHRHRLDNGVTS